MLVNFNFVIKKGNKKQSVCVWACICMCVYIFYVEKTWNIVIKLSLVHTNNNNNKQTKQATTKCDKRVMLLPTTTTRTTTRRAPKKIPNNRTHTTQQLQERQQQQQQLFQCQLGAESSDRSPISAVYLRVYSIIIYCFTIINNQQQKHSESIKWK